MSNSPLIQPAPIDAGERLLIPAREAARKLGISERTLWGITAPRGSIVPVRVGRADSQNRRVLYSVERLREWVAKQTEAASV